MNYNYYWMKRPCSNSSLGVPFKFDAIDGKQIFSYDNAENRNCRVAVVTGSLLRASIITSDQSVSPHWEWLINTLEPSRRQLSIHSILNGTPRDELLQGRIICACKQVGKTTICNTIRDNNLSVVKQVSQMTQAGTGCGSCVNELQLLLDEELAKAV